MITGADGDSGRDMAGAQFLRHGQRCPSCRLFLLHSNAGSVAQVAMHVIYFMLEINLTVIGTDSCSTVGIWRPE